MPWCVVGRHGAEMAFPMNAGVKQPRQKVTRRGCCRLTQRSQRPTEGLVSVSHPRLNETTRRGDDKQDCTGRVKAYDLEAVALTGEWHPFIHLSTLTCPHPHSPAHANLPTSHSHAHTHLSTSTFTCPLTCAHSVPCPCSPVQIHAHLPSSPAHIHAHLPNPTYSHGNHPPALLGPNDLLPVLGSSPLTLCCRHPWPGGQQWAPQALSDPCTPHVWSCDSHCPAAPGPPTLSGLSPLLTSHSPHTGKWKSVREGKNLGCFPKPSPTSSL